MSLNRSGRSSSQPSLHAGMMDAGHYQTWDKHALDFGKKAPTLEKMVMRVIETVQPVLYDHFVTMPTMTDLWDKGTVFRTYPYAKDATDVKFQPANRPTGRFGEQKHYFSGKHKLYGLKIEASVSPEGLLVAMIAHEPGSVSDLTVFATATTSTCLPYANFPESWAVLVDKGYVGLTGMTRAIHPKKRPVHGVLYRADVECNTNVSSDRVIVENFFGRYRTSTIVWGTKCYDSIQRLTFALTNFHLALMPLRQDDCHQYRAVLARYRRMAEENNAKRAAIQRRYVAK
ncbi:hypothetical protein H257_06107 [Aphanomyces astaci]|uniref:DDE Tnp4 domain-containing protein n=1 Tax=Aphanomyces astaci TaxID=112090 RepID=W4GNY9_APHAT|nr:hypothetical protein H257_06107 [Aphanomyces astaci]ETV80573.1 hypothetical protein H257_06107 [Aphanomyces astaci]|eukprot:XP_009829520.1 hypothetical protein H257_06107 [Aphanomyces astaci]